MFSLSILAQSSTFDAILDSFPTDPGALFTLALTAVAFIAVIVGGRNKGPGSGPKGAA